MEQLHFDALGLQGVFQFGQGGICGSVRNVLDRFYGKVEGGELSGRKLYFVFQGAAPEKWMLDAVEYTMKRFAGLYGMTYGGMATNKNEATKLGKNI